MPTYEYACKDCGEHLDVVQSFHDDPLTECPNCRGSLRKVFSAAGIIFKGSGWHIKDYAGNGASTSGSSQSSGDSDTSSSDSSDSSSDAKPSDSSSNGSSESSTSTSTDSSSSSAASA